MSAHTQSFIPDITMGTSLTMFTIALSLFSVWFLKLETQTSLFCLQSSAKEAYLQEYVYHITPRSLSHTKDAKKVLVKPSTTPAVALAAIIGRVTQSVVTLYSGPPQPELEALVGHVEPGQALDRTVDMKKDQVRVHGFSCPICIF